MSDPGTVDKTGINGGNVAKCKVVIMTNINCFIKCHVIVEKSLSDIFIFLVIFVN